MGVLHLWTKETRQWEGFYQLLFQHPKAIIHSKQTASLLDPQLPNSSLTSLKLALTSDLPGP